MLPANLGKSRKPRKDALYSREEIKVISKYKEEYKQQTTPQMQGMIFKTKILVNMFNYWVDNGNEPGGEEECICRMKVNLMTFQDTWLKPHMQELAAWVRNNWCPYATVHDSKTNVKINSLNVVWELHTEAAEEELKAILEVEQLNNKDPGVFQQRNAAAKRVIQNMSERDQAEFFAIVEVRKVNGNPEAIRHR